MSLHESYRDQTFRVDDPDARIRVSEDDLLSFARYREGDAIPEGRRVGDFELLPQGVDVRVTDVRIVPLGSRVQRAFARAESLDGRTVHGWTSTLNFAGRFRNVTVGRLEPAADAGRYSAHAAWEGGEFVGLVSLVRIVDVSFDIETLTESMVGPYLAMVEHARSDGVELLLTSGFRSYPDQAWLYHGYRSGRPGFNLAAPPGRSHHQNGTALDLAVAGAEGDVRYGWLAENATAHGFVRTVQSEPWHWEFRPEASASARSRGSHRLWA